MKRILLALIFIISCVMNVYSQSCGIPRSTLFGTTQKTATSARPDWAAVSGALSYNVEYRIRNVGASYSAPINTTNKYIVLTNLQPSTNYEFIVQTVCSSGLSAFSSSGWFTTLAGSTTTCGPPSSLTISSITNTSSSLNWPTVSSATGYIVRYKTISSSTWITASSSDNSETLTGLQLGTAYECQVQSICSAGSSSFSVSYNFTTTGGVVLTSVPQFSHIVVVIGENTKASSVYGRSSAPYINSLLSGGAKFSNSYGITHPSQPNYLHLFSGANQGVTTNNVPSSHFTTPNLARELINAGKTFITYADGLPSVGWDGEKTGDYRRRHNPVTNWMGNGTNQVSSAVNQPFTSFPSSYNNLPSVAFVIPNLCNDGHDVCSPYSNRVKQYDAWIENNLNAYKQWCINNNSLLIITYDEDDGSAANNIATVFYGANVRPGTYSQGINHYNVLRFLEDANGLTTHAGAAANASTIDYCWTSSSVAKNNVSITNNGFELAEVYPNPTSNEININCKEEGNITVQVYNRIGDVMLTREYTDKKSNEIITIYRNEFLNQASGLYFVKVFIKDRVQVFRIVIE